MASPEQPGNPGLNRRAFLKTTAAAAAFEALPGSAKVLAQSVDETSAFQERILGLVENIEHTPREILAFEQKAWELIKSDSELPPGDPSKIGRARIFKSAWRNPPVDGEVEVTEWKTNSIPGLTVLLTVKNEVVKSGQSVAPPRCFEYSMTISPSVDLDSEPARPGSPEFPPMIVLMDLHTFHGGYAFRGADRVTIDIDDPVKGIISLAGEVRDSSRKIFFTNNGRWPGGLKYHLFFGVDSDQTELIHEEQRVFASKLFSTVLRRLTARA